MYHSVMDNEDINELRNIVSSCLSGMANDISRITQEDL